MGAALAAQGYRLDLAQDVLPADLWVARHAAAGADEWARSVHAGRRVAPGPLAARSAIGAPDQSWPHVQAFAPIEPLDVQFGVLPKKSVPDTLREAIFGQPVRTEAERAAHFLCSAPCAPIRWIIADPRAAKVSVIQGNPKLTAADGPHPFVLGDLELAVFAQIRLSEFNAKLAAYLASTDPAFAAASAAQQPQWVHDVTRTAQLSGTTIEKYVAD